MIKLNLMTGKIDTTMQGGEGISISASDDGGGGQSDTLVKIALLLLPVVALFAWEFYNISGLEEKSKSLQVRLSQQVQTMQALKMKAGKADLLITEVQKLEEKLQIVSGLSKKRLQELKAMDYLQTIVPDGLWLESINYDGMNLEFVGGAINDKDLSLFVSSLESSSYFQQVILLKSTEKKQAKGTVKSFKISSVLGSVK